MFGLKQDIGIDLGTANILVYVRGQGVVLNEPSVVAVDKDLGRILAVGEEARDMLGRTPGNIVAIRPLREGVIADFTTTESMIKYFVNKVKRKGLFSGLYKNRLMICVPAGVTSVEKRAVMDAAQKSGADNTFLIEEPVAAALGAGLRIDQSIGSMVVDIGGGTTDIAVLSLGGVVCSLSIRIGGDKFDDAIMNYMKSKHKLLVGERTAEAVKIEIGSASVESEQKSMKVRGRNMLTGLPSTITVNAKEIAVAIQEQVLAIVGAVREVLEKTPPELAADIFDRGIVMTGGGALLRNLSNVIKQHTDIEVIVANNSMDCVAIGTGMALDNLDVLAKTVKI